VEQGVDLVVNLAAGLDARPYRMALPASLLWVEIDLPDLLAYKEEILAREKPVCAVERLRLDLSQPGPRREVFEALGRRGKKALVISEGLIVYLEREEVASLARDLAAPPSFKCWATDLGSPGLIRMLQKRMGAHLEGAAAPLKFGPPEGPAFFAPYGWKALEVHSILHAAARAGRLSFLLRLAALFPEANGPQGSRPWSGACLLGRE
jgi:O-methyltransferase involved in polyketide biosynthesis